MTRAIVAIAALAVLATAIASQPGSAVVVGRVDQHTVQVAWSPPGRAVVWRQRAGATALVGLADGPPLVVAGGDAAIRLEPCDRVIVAALDDDGIPRVIGSAGVPHCLHLPAIGR